jgi:hypothetical protein
MFFSILQIARARSPPNGLVFQILDQHNKISDLMHLYFQSAHEEHQMGLVHTIIQFVKSVAHIASPCCEAIQPLQRRGTCPLHNKVDPLEDLFRAVVIPSIGNNYEGHNKPPQFQELNQHMH